MRDLDSILTEDPYSFAETLRPASAQTVRVRGDQRRRRQAAVMALVAAAILAGGGAAYARLARPGTQPARPAAPGVHPAFLVTAVDGQAAVLQAATDRTVAHIRPPAGVFAFEGVAAVPGDHEFFLAGAAHAGAGVRIEFFRLLLSPSGQPGSPQRLPGAPYLAPMPVSSDGLTTIPLAASPDGTELAYPSVTRFPVVPGSILPAGTDSVIVQDVATGARRSWGTWAGSHATVSSVSWSAEGQVGVVATMADAAVSHGVVIERPGSALTAFLLLDTTTEGTTLVGDSRLIGYGAATAAAVAPGALGGALGIRDGVVSRDGRSAYVLLTTGRGRSELAVITVATGKISRVLLSGTAAEDPAMLRGGAGAATSAGLSLDGSSLLFPLNLVSVLHQTTGASYVTGHLAVVDVVTGRITRLPYPLYFGSLAPLPPVIAAW